MNILSTHLLITLGELCGTLFVESHDDANGLLFVHDWGGNHACCGVFGLLIHKVTEVRVLEITKTQERLF